MNLRTFALAAAAFACLAPLAAAPIPGLFNTGVDGEGVALPAGVAVDPHYTVTDSPDASFPGPDAFTSGSFPAPPWLLDNEVSRWISPNSAGGNAAPGDYTIATTFDLTGFDPATAEIVGSWSSDNLGVDIVLNGEPQFWTNDGNFGAFTDFFLDTGFVEGVNTLEFIFNNAGDAPNPAGLRVEMVGSVADPAGSAPSFLVQPRSGTKLLEGDSYTLVATADGEDPITLQWFKDDAEIAGATGSELVLDELGLDDTGAYKIVATNPNGSTTSNTATVAVHQRLGGLYNTGVDDAGVVLLDFELDTHYTISVNPDSEFPEPVVQDTLAFPIADGTWLLPNDQSAWIGPNGDTSGAAGGDYHYLVTVDLTGLDPDTAFISGVWSSDNSASILLNGAPTGQVHDGAFNTFRPFSIDATGGAPFLTGVNTVEFVVNNAGAGYTGLRVEDIVGGALPGDGSGGAPEILFQPESQFAFPDESASFSVLADGAAPLSYQWRRDGEALPGEIGSTLFVFTGSPEAAATYDVVVTNGEGETTSSPATLTILDLVPGLFATGVDDEGNPVPDFEPDPHYTLIENAHDPGFTEAFVQDEFALPGAWVAITDGSRWIGPTTDTNGFPGTYVYRTSVSLDGFDPDSAVLIGSIATDDGLSGIAVNGVTVPNSAGGGFTALADFTIEDAFGPGVNTIDFTIANGGADPNPTGLHLASLRLGAFAVAPADLPPLTIERVSPTEVKLAWPDGFDGWVLNSSPGLASWTPVATPPVNEGGMLTLTVTIGEDTYFRLELPAGN